MASDKTYRSDPTEEQSRFVEDIVAGMEPGKRGRPREWAFRVPINAILYVVKTGCQWRMLPADFPPRQTVYHHFNKWCRNGVREVWKLSNTPGRPTKKDISRLCADAPLRRR